MGQQFYLAVGSLNRQAPYFQGARGEGLTIYSFDEARLEWKRIASTKSVDNPTFLAVDAAGGVIYANSEVFGWHEGTLSAFRFDAREGSLTYLNKQPTLGSITAYNMVTRDRRFVLAANYAMGTGGPDKSVAVFPILENGGLAPASGSLRLEGKLGPKADRQERPHAHMVTEVPEGGSVLIADLGLDLIAQFRLAGNGTLSPVASVHVPAGSGPRHIAQHFNGRFLYVSNELTSTVSFIRRSPGDLTVEQTISTIWPRTTSHAADIHLSPDGRFLYCSNRGDDSIVSFAVDPVTGTLTLLDIVPSGGKTPRNFTLTPSGKHLLVANQNGDSIVIFTRDEETGALTDSGKRIEIGTPVCVRPFIL
ncbi:MULTISPECIES: lactonase family protein [unclassified Rhizobium]|uniref:lactonase family protein n=1 Tax=unclassified Rhizobium TaxID=2613769 RepID=UPI000712F391|nr:MULTISPECIES: lactonase family protein [unclassified Rhizobium]KQS83554.1 6-phosphogluconolactonase [Rhizobium sp. Leaf386]KQT03797.1 6-phosphogluconolactonase [Rhizobium sp. Leaf391]KQU03647.1 6-phosphogluconolactonase [Rhizobium sp. Leaf453]